VTAWPFSAENPALGLVTADPPPGKDFADLVDPFLEVSDRGTFSRVLLGELLGPTGRSVLPLAVKLQGDEYPIVPEGDAPVHTSAAVEAAWRREAALLERTGPAASGLPVVIEVLPRTPGDTAHLPPTIYCKRRRAFFPAACPDCGGPLADVRDDRLLEARGLPRRDRSLARFVGCPACLARGAGRFWTLIKDARLPGEVGDQSDLFRAFARLARSEGRSIPCQGCEHVPACHPADASTRPDVLRALTPVTFYESRCLVTDVHPLRYDEAVALAGGASPGDVVAAAEPGRRALLDRLAAHLERETPYLFAHDAAGKLGLEVLRLKLGLFAQLCRAVALLHRASREPHLGLTPARALAGLGGERAGLPWLWRLGVTLTGLGNAVPRPLPAGDAADLPVASFARPRLVDPVYAPAALRDAPLADLAGTLTVRRVSDAPGGRTVVEAELEAEAVDLGAVGALDTVDVAVVQGRPPLSLTLVGVPVASEGAGLRLRSLPLALDATTRETLAQVVGQALARARFTVHPCLHVSADVHALGMILFTTLLAGPGRPTAQVAGAVREAAQALATAAVPEGRGRVAAAAGSLRNDAFARTALFARPAEHAAAAAAIPEDLWTEVLVVGLRAVTAVPGFSICRSAADFDPGRPEVKAEFLLQLTETLLRRVDAALFGLPGRAREMRAALARVARDLKVE
jgi:ribosomal protein L34E